MAKDDLKIFFELITKKTSLNQLSKKVKITQPNLTYYKNGKCLMSESFFNYALKLIGKTKKDFNYEILPPNWGCNKKKLKQIKRQDEMTIEKVRIISHLLFDGTVCNKKGYYYIRFICSSPKVIRQFINDIKIVYGLEKYETYKENNNGCKSISINSILLIQDLMNFANTYSCKSKDICIPNVIKYGKIDFKREFLRCFWSDEGGIVVTQKTKRFFLIGAQKNISFLREIAKLHKNFGIKYRIYEKLFRIDIIKKSEQKKFLERIGFLDGSLVTKGNYKGMEKNILLKKLLFNKI
ncbi:MAG: hypothetical protein HWN67_07080 [Candidatus Helarchaeota archaeon]|nr:hypothetical protein [Candidatus Helarchaeota archaeon]